LKHIVREAKTIVKRGSATETISELGINKNSSISSSKFVEDSKRITHIVGDVHVEKICLNEDSST